MPVISAYKRIQRIADFALSCKSRDQLVAFLSSNVCPFGELVAAGTANLGEDGYVRTEFRYGFSTSIEPPPPVHISADHPSVRTLIEMQIQVIDMNGLHKRYEDIPSSVKPNSEYIVSITLPATTSKIYGFAFQRDVRIMQDYLDYFECILSILSNWEKMNSTKTISRLSHNVIENSSLTIRQEKIVELIKEGRTNTSIASILGYSESLIRQETIIIYRKMGVNGRRGLLESTDKGEQIKKE